MWQLWHFHERQFSRGKIVPTFSFLNCSVCDENQVGRWGEVGRWGGQCFVLRRGSAVKLGCRWRRPNKKTGKCLDLSLAVFNSNWSPCCFLFWFQNESILPNIFFVIFLKFWCNVLPPNCQPLPIRSWTSFPSPAGLKWHQTPEHRCNADTKGGPWVEMLPDTSARLFLLPPQDMGMLGGREERSRISAVNIAFLTIPGNSLQYCVGRLLWQES